MIHFSAFVTMILILLWPFNYFYRLATRRTLPPQPELTFACVQTDALVVVASTQRCRALPLPRGEAFACLSTLRFCTCCSCFWKVDFKTFFMADQLNSLVIALVDLTYSFCYYGTGDFWDNSGSHL